MESQGCAHGAKGPYSLRPRVGNRPIPKIGCFRARTGLHALALGRHRSACESARVRANQGTDSDLAREFRQVAGACFSTSPAPPAKNKYLSSKSSFRAADVASKFITGRPSAAEYTAAADLSCSCALLSLIWEPGL